MQEVIGGVMSTNEHGLDVRYISSRLSRVARNTRGYTPAEMAQELVNLAYIIDSVAALEEMKNLNTSKLLRDCRKECDTCQE